MRLFPAVNIHRVKINIALAGAFLLAPVSLAYAQNAYAPPPPIPAYNLGPGQQSPSSANAGAANQSAPQAIDRNSYLQGMQAALGLGGPGGNIATPPPPPEETYLGDATDPNSDRYKSEQLANKAIEQRKRDAALNPQEDMTGLPAPPDVETLQMVNESLGSAAVTISEESAGKEMSVDLRKDAQKEAALSYGARGGLAKHNYEIMERMRDFDPVLDKVFNFRQLLIHAPSGLLIEPPIVKESDNALVITEDGNEAAVAKQVYDINKRAKIVSAPRDWRHYLVQSWSDVPPPPRILWPKNAEEQARWNLWVAQGWRAGVEQAEQIFESNTNRLVADYNGMVRYKLLLAQNMISQPYAMHEDRGVTGDKNQMRVGDRALRITGPSQFLTGADLWKPADR